jgi:protein-L-isoaspartate(D-aspartate) O-methyltransferase
VSLADDAGLGGFLLSLRAAGFRDPALAAAIEATPRAAFLPEDLKAHAWRHISLPLPHGQETGAPRQVVRVVSEIAARTPRSVLEIGTGSGWQAGLLARLVPAVTTLERDLRLSDAARLALSAAGVSNVNAVHGNGFDVPPGEDLFDVIVLNGTVAEIPGALLDRVAPTGCVLVPRKLNGHPVRLELIERRGDSYVTADLGTVTFPPLVAGLAGAH